MVVPKPLIGQTASEFLRLYPSANILVATERDFEKSRRKQFISRIATGDYDCTVFEEMCRYYTLMKGITGEYGCFVTSVGTWWGVENIKDKNGDVRVQPADIDVVALSEIDKKAVIGECKFKNEKIDKGIYDTLIRRGKLITAKYKVSKYIFFSLSGYTEWFKTLSDEDVLLLTLDSLYTIGT